VVYLFERLVQRGMTACWVEGGHGTGRDPAAAFLQQYPGSGSHWRSALSRYKTTELANSARACNSPCEQLVQMKLRQVSACLFSNEVFQFVTAVCVWNKFQIQHVHSVAC
jgi:hypothetical protein